jgi:hypothetical protein
MLRAAIVYNDDEQRVFVSIDPDDFTVLLQKYFDRTGSIKEAMKLIEFDLKKKTMYK